jgi:[protein-PII] uridylyltransferase
VVDIRPDERGTYIVLSLVASDRPGLLYSIARTLTNHKLNIHTARVNTLGDRAEDVFLVSGGALSNPKTVLQIEQDLVKDLQI